ncbi:hypothetical protein M8J77_009273 [Diaphorina citri]|nr:hypothetical protein M8J77_009273 [Diaphorina citri]
MAAVQSYAYYAALMWWYPCLVAYLLSSLTVIQAELYTALADMEELLTTEVVLIRTLDQYIEAQEERLKMLKKYSNGFKMEHAEAAKDVPEYLANPINAFLVVKRLTLDWKQAEHYMKDHVYQASDCFELGRQSYNTQDFYHTALWMGEALKRHDMERNGTSTPKWEILEYLAYSKFMQVSNKWLHEAGQEFMRPCDPSEPISKQELS